MRKIIFCILVLIGTFSCFAWAGRNDYGIGKYTDITDDLKRQDDESRKTREILDQIDRDRKQADEVIRQERYEAKTRQEELKRETLEAERKLSLGKVSPGSVNAPSDIIFTWLVKYGLYLLIAVCFWAFYYYGIILSRRKQFEDEEDSFGRPQSNLLAVVNQWRFAKKDFKSYQDKFLIFAPAEILDVNSPEFKKHFVNDLAVTEILFQDAVSRNLGREKEFNASLSSYKVHLEELLKDGHVFLNLLNNYKLSLKLTSWQGSGYAAYYKEFLDLLMLVNRNSETDLLALYGRRLLIDKLVSQIVSEPSATDKIQQEFDKIIDKFRQENKVLIIKNQEDIIRNPKR